MNSRFHFQNRFIKLLPFAAILSIFNLLLFNIPFFDFVIGHVESSGFNSISIVASLAIIMLAANFLAALLVLFLFRTTGKIIIAAANFLSAAGLHFVVTYNVILDSSMMGNLFNTRYSEASGFITVKFILFLLIAGVVPAYFIIRQKTDWGNWKRFSIGAASSIVIIAAVIGLNFKNFLWIGKYDTELGGLLMPWSYTVNTCRYISQKHGESREEVLLPDAVVRDTSRTAVVLVIGESARKANFSLYGYDRPTNPLLSQRNDIHIFNARSCATYTTAGVKSILECKDDGTLYEILPNYLFRNGADVIWRTANWGEPPVHIDEYATAEDLKKTYDCPDKNYNSILFAGLKERILSSRKDKFLAVIHTSTSHGPCYYEQYPPRFEVFTPVCKNVEAADKSVTELVNAYDNTILYTDYLVNAAICDLEKLEGWHTVLIFVSDHGESLGEKDLFMHGVPMKLAPPEQYEIPFIVWTSEGTGDLRELELIDQHSVFHSVLDILGFDSPVLDREKSIFTPETGD